MGSTPSNFIVEPEFPSQLNPPPPSTPVQQPSVPPPPSNSRSFPLQFVSKPPWSHLFRSPFEPPKAASSPSPASQHPSPQVPQERSDSQPDSNVATFTFCQNKLLAAIEDTKKLVQENSARNEEDKVSTRTLIETLRDENITLHAGVITDGSIFT